MAEPVVLIPGLMCDARIFHYQITALSAECPVMVAAPVNGERIEEMASHILDGLPARFALAGMGMGGTVAMEVLRRAPERVNRLALICVDPQADTPVLAAEREPWIARVRAGRLDDVMSELVTPDMIAQGPRRMKVQQLIRNMAQELGADLFIRHQRALQRRRDYQSVLRRVKIPAMVISGTEDASMSVKKAQFLSELIPNSHLRLIENAGCVPSIENPVAMIEALADWSALPLVLE